jgi:hypothetical protein
MFYAFFITDSFQSCFPVANELRTSFLWLNKYFCGINKLEPKGCPLIHGCLRADFYMMRKSVPLVGVICVNLFILKVIFAFILYNHGVARLLIY